MSWNEGNDNDAAGPPTPPPSDTEFERRLVDRLSFEFLREQRRARRWGIFFKLLAVIYVTVLLVVSMPNMARLQAFTDDRITALVDVQGVIAHGSEASADNVVRGLRDAFEDGATAGVILRINSPGGSPVQAGYINDEIYRLREEHPDIPLYAVIEDVCASGGYYIAAAADRIYADKASIVGSIGVRMDSFGFVESLDKLGVERRLLTAGENKGFLDPFLPLDPAHVEHVNELLGQVHEQFINTVLKGRRDKLADDPAIFSGLFWSGERSLALGLIDEFGSAGRVAREVIGAEDIVDFTRRDYSLEGLLKRGGTSIVEQLLARARLGW